MFVLLINYEGTGTEFFYTKFKALKYLGKIKSILFNKITHSKWFNQLKTIGTLTVVVISTLGVEAESKISEPLDLENHSSSPLINRPFSSVPATYSFKISSKLGLGISP